MRVWQLPVESLLTGGFGTLPLAPISAVTKEQLPGVVARMKERLTAPDAPAAAKDLWTAVYVLMGLRYEQPLIHHLLRGVIAMEESVTYQEIVQEGVVKGKVQEARQNLLLVGTRRFKAPPAEATAAVEAVTDLVKLEALISRAFDVTSWEELLGLPPGRTRRRKSSP